MEIVSGPPRESYVDEATLAVSDSQTHNPKVGFIRRGSLALLRDVPLSHTPFLPPCIVSAL